MGRQYQLNKQASTLKHVHMRVPSPQKKKNMKICMIYIYNTFSFNFTFLVCVCVDFEISMLCQQNETSFISWKYSLVRAEFSQCI